jgi:hypothetical protein
MATQITNLEVKHRHKTVIINSNFAALPHYLGELASAPAVLGVSEGSTFYNTGSSKLMFLNSVSTWVNVA